MGRATPDRIERDPTPVVSADVSVKRQLACSVSIFLWLAVLLVLLIQPDLLAAVTLVPPWCWLVAGCVLALLGWSRANRWWSLLAVALWILLGFVFVDEAKGLRRMVARAVAPAIESPTGTESLRVISLNCANEINAAKEVLAYKPDIVLLQESPGQEQIAELAQSLFGASAGFLHKGDTAIIVDGSVTDLTPESVSHFAHANARLTGGRQVAVVSLRLAPPVFRMDIWSPGFWTDHRDRRSQHRQEIDELLGHLRTSSPRGLLVLGGDFNTTPIDLALVPLKSRVFDMFLTAGQGWGNTGTNDYPLFRVDQIWASRGFKALSATARRTMHSDHRLVVSDLQISSSRAP